MCEQPIQVEDVEYELVFRPNAHDLTVQLHLACYSAWRMEVKAKAFLR